MNKSNSNKENKNSKTAIEVAALYLANRMRTVKEMRDHLYVKGFSETEVNEAVNDLIGLRYLDDYDYARRYYEYNASKHRGSRRAMLELEQKGVDKETIKFALEDFMYESDVDEYRMALEIARREVRMANNEIEADGYVGSTDDIEPSELKIGSITELFIAKVARKLDAKGFSSDIIYKVMNDMRRWDDEEYN